MLKSDLSLMQKHIFGDALTEAEQKRFDLQLQNDAEFQKKYADYQKTTHMIRRVARQEMRIKLKNFEKTGKLAVDDDDEKRPFAFSILGGGNTRIWIGAAASVALLVCLSIWYFQKPALSFETVVEMTTFRSFNYLNLATVRSKQVPPKNTEQPLFDTDIAYLTSIYGAENAEKLVTAMLDLKDKRYTEAVAVLADLPLVANNDSIRLSRADAYLGANDIEKAIADYTVVAQNQTPQYKDLRMIADWHLALAYLKKGDRKESQRRIEIIAKTTGHNFQREAMDVLKMW
jgi:tetratricopeptide (TPR) repeat protein